MNAIALRRQRDPYDTDGIVGPWRQIERLVGVYALEVERGIVVVGRILGDGCDLHLTSWRWSLAAADCGGVGGGEAALSLLGKHALVVGVDLDARDFSPKIIALHLGDDDLRPRAVEASPGVEPAQQRFTHVELFRKELQRARIA